MGLLTQSLTGTPCTTGKSLYSAKEAEEYYSYPNDSSAISRILMPCELLETLVQHGCRDVTSFLNIEKCDPLPTMIGGFGAVYQGILHNGLKIAIKSIQPTFNSHSRKLIKRAAREIHAWSECTHQNVVPLVGVACFRGQLAMVSPWMENGNLMRYLSIHQPSLEGRLGLATQIAEGLAHLHQSGIVHGDLKATNVLVSEDMKAVITDFGGSTIKENSVEFINSTRGVDVSIRWAAPEILLGQDTPTCTADVYALGMTLLVGNSPGYFLHTLGLTARKETFTDSEPYAGLHDATVWAKIIRQVLPERPEKHLPTGDAQVDLLWLLLNRCWATDPSSRPTATSARDKMREIDSLGPSESIMRDFIIGEGREQQSTGDPGYQSSATVLGR